MPLVVVVLSLVAVVFVCGAASSAGKENEERSMPRDVPVAYLSTTSPTAA